MDTYEHTMRARWHFHFVYVLFEYERENRKIHRESRSSIAWVCRAWCVQCVHLHIHARIHFIYIYTHIHRNMYACNHFKYIINFFLSIEYAACLKNNETRNSRWNKNMVTLGFKPDCDFDVENRHVTFENNRSRYCWDRRHDSRCWLCLYIYLQKKKKKLI